MAQTVSCGTVAKALNLTERRVMQLVNEGMPRQGRGEYDPWACALWYVRYLQKAVEQRGIGNDDGSATSFQDVWHELAKEWNEAQHHPEKMKAFVNLRLAQTWDEGAESITEFSLAKRREEYTTEVSAKVAALVATVDVQVNRLEAQITGFGPGEEQYLIDHRILWGPPGLLPGQKENEDQVNVWDDLDDYLLKTWQHTSGATLRPAITLVDAGA